MANSNMDLGKRVSALETSGSGGGGSNLHEYSTDKKLVGKWIDGKNVYEVTIIFDAPKNIGGGGVLVYSDESISKVVNIRDFNNYTGKDNVSCTLNAYAENNGVYVFRQAGSINYTGVIIEYVE